MSRPRPSSLPRPRSSHLIEDFVNWTVQMEHPPDLVDRMDARGFLAEKETFLPDLEFDGGSWDEPKPLPRLNGHGDLPLGSDGASHRRRLRCLIQAVKSLQPHVYRVSARP